MSVKKQIFLHLLLLVLAILLFECTPLDIWVQDHCYSFETHTWAVNRKDPVKKLLFYTGIKDTVALFALTCLITLIASCVNKSLNKWRRPASMMLVALILVPLIVAGAKHVTNVPCPSALEHYGGHKPYVPLWRYVFRVDVPNPCGCCFPAGHATGGFALMMLYFVLPTPRQRKLGLLLGLTLGWVMGTYQILKGAHFLSHTVVTMIASWIVILGIKSFFPDPVENA